MRINQRVYIDETGTLGAPKDSKPYGAGWCGVDPSNVKAVEKILENNKLDSIHLKDTRGDRRKLNLAKKIGNLHLEKFKVFGGAVIQANSDHALDNHKKLLYNHVLQNPELFLKCLDASDDFSDKLIITPDEISPFIIKDSRYREYVHMFTRYIFLSIIQLYPSVTHLELDFWLSSIGDSTKYRKKILEGLDIFDDLKDFIRQLKNKKISPLSEDNVNLKGSIVEDASNFFGLADLFAGVGQLLKSKEKNKHKLGEDMYEHLAPLFKREITCENEYVSGIYSK